MLKVLLGTVALEAGYSNQNLVSDFGFHHWIQGVSHQMINPKISALSIHKKLHKHFFKNNNCIN